MIKLGYFLAALIVIGTILWKPLLRKWNERLFGDWVQSETAISTEINK